jgi:hypothetical protein
MALSPMVTVPEVAEEGSGTTVVDAAQRRHDAPTSSALTLIGWAGLLLLLPLV